MIELTKAQRARLNKIQSVDGQAKVVGFEGVPVIQHSGNKRGTEYGLHLSILGKDGRLVGLGSSQQMRFERHKR